MCIDLYVTVYVHVHVHVHAHVHVHVCVCGCVVSVYVCVYTSGEGSYDDPIRVALLQSSNLYHTLLARSASSSMIMSFWEPLRG